MAKILVFAGSARKGSVNKMLATAAAKMAERAGAEVTHIDLADYSMPIYDQDLEQAEGMPAKAVEFKQLMIDADGFLIASPEYNSAFSPLLKNVIDWASRSESDDEPPLAAYRGKTAAIVAASPGSLGGLRGLVFLRMLLSNLGVLVIPQQHAISGATQVFDASGAIIDNRARGGVESVVRGLVETLDKLS